ncbi:exodeoxyribonuclease VII large subunit [Limisphaera ngatamarikiensis]|uniref:Exodeoxyribonuclease 7 large subunit n=1 Tax=Limisphaera ngatamarikiensis TaxID=1324935 RepID=A0A6M1S491_9BACT|nr:exodeoxyribonuclease VII large subunit [Limisphaera ngatamarikiensis]NGO40110.1 exodeoxyribonuclease VII large subunit [Limisphaera ngatamarikiensis]
MGRTAKHQWEFGELFAREPTRRVWTVSELTLQIRRLLEQQIGQVWVSGEISNLRIQSSGHAYFTLKDAAAQIACVLFRGEAVPRRELLADGQKVIVCGDLTVYEPRGQYQLVIRALEFQGVGTLQLAFEQLKKKLAAEGLFAQERKRPLPRHPRRVGLVTSPTGAAIRDVLHVARRRNPMLEFILVPCRVQGEGAALEIAAAIRLLNEFALAPIPQPTPAGGPLSEPPPRLDVILVTRGGGSLEDLWAFNEEIVARAIAASAIPVVSAVGHEIDFTISDFVADLRAATPSAAAEILTEDVHASRDFLAQVPRRLAELVLQHLDRARQDLEAWEKRLQRAHPRRQIETAWQRWDELVARLRRAGQTFLSLRVQQWQHLVRGLYQARPAVHVQHQRQWLESMARRLRQTVAHQLQIRKQRWTAARSRLVLLGPEQVLARGYSLTFDPSTGRLVRNADEVRPGQPIRTRVHRGEILSRVEQTRTTEVDNAGSDARSASPAV